MQNRCSTCIGSWPEWWPNWLKWTYHLVPRLRFHGLASMANSLKNSPCVGFKCRRWLKDINKMNRTPQETFTSDSRISKINSKIMGTVITYLNWLCRKVLWCCSVIIKSLPCITCVVLFISQDHVAVWNGKQAVVYEISQAIRATGIYLDLSITGEFSHNTWQIYIKLHSEHVKMTLEC